MNLEKAVHYIQSRGSEEVQARLHYILTGERPSASQIQMFFQNQMPNGGFPDVIVDEYASIGSTCHELASAEQMGLDADEPVAARMLQFLLDRQQPDGRFGEDEAMAEYASEWDMPGSLQAELNLTATAGFWLALFGQRQAAWRAAHFLLHHLDIVNGELETFEFGRWLAGALWWQFGLTGSAETVFETLREDVRKMNNSSRAQLLSELLLAGVPRDHWLVQAAAARLETMQEEDGSYYAYANIDEYTTLEVVRGLLLFYGGPNL
jgi:hypothetical protein